MNKLISGVTAVILCTANLCWIPVANAAESSPRLNSISFSGFYLSGTYGHAQRTDILYMPFTARFMFDHVTYSASLPFLSVSGPGNVLLNVGAVGTGGTVRTTHSGMGDIRLGADYQFWNDNANGLALALGARVKLGTASHSAGLGTGKNDYAVQLRLSRAVRRLYLAGTAGYREQGSPAGLQLRNVAYGEADIIYSLREGDSIGLSTFYNQASIATGTTRLMSTAYFTRHLDSAWATTFYAMKGFTRSSPDYGAGISIRYNY